MVQSETDLSSTIRHQKSQVFWRQQVENSRSSPRLLWQTVDKILGRSKLQSCDDIDVEQFSRFFNEKVARVRQSTDNSPPPTFTAVPDGVNFSAFAAVTADDVLSVIGRLPDKSSAADPIPTSVLKAISGLVVPYIVELFNRSFVTGQFPSACRHAFITPIVKKAGLDAADVNSYRPISNLSVLSKTFERVAARQLTQFLNQHRLMPTLQSGF